MPDQSGTIIPNDELVAQNTEVEEEDDESELEGVKGIFGDTEKLLSNENLGDASPTPILIVIFCSLGTCITDLYPSFSLRAGTISLLYFSFKLII